MRPIKKRTPVILENITITDAGSEGQAVAKVNDLVIFVSGAVPGDIVDVELTHKKKNYAEAKVLRLIHASDKRAKAACEHSGVCGGCKWQNMEYTWQLHYKQKHAYDCLQRIAKMPLPELTPILPSATSFYYRNKLEYTFSNKKWLTLEEIQNKSIVFGEEENQESRNALGFHIPKMFDKILDIQHCHLQGDPSNAIRLFIKKYALQHQLSFFDIRNQEGFLRNLIIRNASSGELMVILSVFYEDKEAREALLNALANEFPAITSLMYVINSKRNDTISDLDISCFKGKDHIMEQMEDLKFKVGPKSFYQTNSEQAYQLYKITRAYAGLTGNEVVYDLYTGTGTIANFVARQAKKVVGVEYVEAAIDDAKINSSINDIHNTSFYAGDMKDVLNDEFILTNGKPDVVITDPPRAGMHEDVVKKLAELSPGRIVYVSCNPATQARDLALLADKYNITKVQPVDMFPHTHHVENVVLLSLKQS